jgi:predicted O-methyltransferase YrrM
MTTVEEILALAADADGWMTEAQGRRLHHAAARCHAPARIVEIGSFRGRSTIVLAASAAAGVEVVAIDPHAGNDRGPGEIDGYVAEAASDRDAFLGNLERAGVADRVRHVARFSDAAHAEVADPIDVLYIDGAHRYAPARADIRSWGHRVADGGTLLIHDSFSSVGVTMAILRELVPGRRFRYVGRSRSLAEYRADLPISGVGRLGNAAAQLAQLGWFARNLGLKVALTAGYGSLARRLGRPVPEWPY